MHITKSNWILWHVNYASIKLFFLICKRNYKTGQNLNRPVIMGDIKMIADLSVLKEPELKSFHSWVLSHFEGIDNSFIIWNNSDHNKILESALIHFMIPTQL